MKTILVSGAGGLVGARMVRTFLAGGNAVVRLSRTPPASGERAVLWDPEKGVADVKALEGLDAVVHLAGESIASGRWNAERKDRIRSSRVLGTRLLCENLAKLEQPPRVFVGASAVGYYGSRGDEVVTEESTPGTGFLAEVCRDWEKAAEPALAKGIRVVHLRFGVILDADGGALAKMLLPFKLGLGGVIGDGKQYMSWISAEDAVGAIQHAITNDALRGPINCVVPQSATNHDFTKTLGQVLGRPTFLPMPAFAARLAFGEMADELLLSSTRAKPAKLEASGFAFRHPMLEAALRHILKPTGT